MSQWSPSEPRRPRRRRRFALTLAGVGVLIAGVALDQPEPTQASWTRSTYSNATLSSGQVNPVTSLTCNAASGLIGAPIRLNWTQPVTTGNGLVPTSYTMTWSGSAGSGQTPPVAGLTATVEVGVLSAGSLTVVVYANFGTWQSAISTQSRTVTLIKVVVLVSWTCEVPPS